MESQEDIHDDSSDRETVEVLEESQDVPARVALQIPQHAMDNKSETPRPPRLQTAEEINLLTGTVNEMPPIPEEISESSGTSPDLYDIEEITESLKDVTIETQVASAVKPTVEHVIQMIKNGECKNIITMVGAGISTSAGIPDFRTPGSGMYHKVKLNELPYPEAIFELKYFMMNPKPFFEMVKDLLPGNYMPTKAHYFIKLLQVKELLLRHYTQNIDNLERVTGLNEDKLVEAHGTFYRSHCLRCNREYDFDWLTEKIFDGEIPTCHCEGLVKPDIVFYGEPLPPVFFERAEEDFRKCDLLIIMGSSRQVEPFASLLKKVSSNCIRLLINKDTVGKAAGLIYNTPTNVRDVAWIENCDTACELMVEKLDWTDEWLSLVS